MDIFISNPTMHNHRSSPDRIPVIQLYNRVKQSVAITDQPSGSIFNSALRTFPTHVVGELPKTENIVQTIRQQHRKPTVRSNELLLDLKEIYRGVQFLLYEDNEIIILATKSNSSILKQCKHRFADETFEVSSQLSNTHS